MSLRQPTHDRFTVADTADAGALRRAVSRYAERLHVGPGRGGRAELVVTELATNLLRHAETGGWVLVRSVLPASIEFIAVDRGPGIADTAPAVSRSATTGLGCGLAAVRRASSYFDLHSEPGRGTTVLAVVDLDGGVGAVGRPAPPARRSWAGVSVGLDEACGDGWAAADVDHGLAVAVVDGLGHGPQASIAADAAVGAFATDPADVGGFVNRANDAMRTTRGGAVAVCRLEPDRRTMHYLAVGNVSGRVLADGKERGLVSHSGTLGMHASPPRAKAMTYPWPPGAALVLWTDGLSSRIDLSGGAGLFAHDPAVVAATLHRDHSREHDDATVVVVRDPGLP